MQIHSLLLDTHVWIWLMNGDKTLSHQVLKVIDDAYQAGQVFVSAISVWEVAMLEQRKRIILNKPCLEWVNTAIRHGIQVLPITPEIAVESCHLPNYSAGDPADRIIIATARMESLCLLTRDERIHAYAAQQTVIVHPV